jgi:hypothetical protein
MAWKASEMAWKEYGIALNAIEMAWKTSEITWKAI